ncbi:recombinase RecT [Paraburkholderia bengalensis]|uniref:Recombinase RecT n=1 Tax=Paraburkholderia bengalensis TaxID=2747562 RepID=A0ABU8IMS2_9BURK
MSNNNVVKLEGSREIMDAEMSPARMMLDLNTLKTVSYVADLMAEGTVTVPAHLRGKKGDCFAIAMQAMLRWRMDPFAVAQKTHLVNGTLGYEAQLVNAVLQESGAVKGEPEYEYRGEGNTLECRVGFIPAGKNELKWTEWLSFSAVTTKNSPLWKTNPRQQMGYLQVKNWARAYKPGAILGVYTVDELEDNAPPPASRDMGRADEVTPAGNSRTDAVRSKLASKRSATPSVDKIIRDIEAATNAHELKKAIEPVENLASDADKEKARAAYQAKIKAEKERAQQAATQQQDETHGEPPTITLAELQERFAKTTDVDVLDADATLISQLTDEDEQSRACEAYELRRTELIGE